MRQRNGGVVNRETHSKRKTVPAKITKKPYSPPVLEDLGSLDALTLGGQGGSGDAHGGPNTKTPCWIAEVLYGADDARTHLLRRWLVQVYRRTATGSLVVALYRAFGERVARCVRRSALLRRMLTPLFNSGVSAALRHYTLATRSYSLSA